MAPSVDLKSNLRIYTSGECLKSFKKWKLSEWLG